jgi:hypothetical protein
MKGVLGPCLENQKREFIENLRALQTYLRLIKVIVSAFLFDHYQGGGRVPVFRIIYTIC